LNDFSKWIQSGEGGLPYIAVKTDACQGHIYLHGAHVTHYQRAGERPLLFMSAKSHFEKSKPIRGGVPICFPWFSNRGPRPDSPQHGFARLQAWTIQDIRQLDRDTVEVKLQTQSSDATRVIWSEDFRATYTVTFGQELRMAFEVLNTSAQAFKFEEALHTYFAVADIRQAQLTGLSGVPFTTRVQGQQSGTQGPEPIAFTAETDRVYANTGATCIIEDKIGNRRITVEKQNSQTTVVWNPWIDKAKAMPDFGDDEWPHMLCIEAANAFDSAITLQPGQSHSMTQIVR